MSTYSEKSVALDEITTKIHNAKKQLDNAQAAITAAETALAAMPTVYGTIIGDIDSFATDNNADAAALAMKARKDHLVAEFQALKTRATGMKTALSE